MVDVVLLTDSYRHADFHYGACPMPKSKSPVYSITDIAAVGDIASAVVALSDTGIVVGVSESTPAFEWTPEPATTHPADLTSLKVFGSPVVIPAGVNARGDVVGVYVGTDDQPHGFLIHHGEAQDIGTLGGSSAEANAISNNGVVVGASDTASGAIHALAYDRTLHDLGTARPRQLQRGLLGQRSGYRGRALRPVARRRRRGDLQGRPCRSIGTLGGATSAATDVNDGGVVVGLAQLSSGVEHAFIYGSSGEAPGCTISGPWAG